MPTAGLVYLAPARSLLFGQQQQLLHQVVYRVVEGRLQQPLVSRMTPDYLRLRLLRRLGRR